MRARVGARDQTRDIDPGCRRKHGVVAWEPDALLGELADGTGTLRKFRRLKQSRMCPHGDYFGYLLQGTDLNLK